jgi:hypothetical protein
MHSPQVCMGFVKFSFAVVFIANRLFARLAFVEGLDLKFKLLIFKFKIVNQWVHDIFCIQFWQFSKGGAIANTTAGK